MLFKSGLSIVMVLSIVSQKFLLARSAPTQKSTQKYDELARAVRDLLSLVVF